MSGEQPADPSMAEMACCDCRACKTVGACTLEIRCCQHPRESGREWHWLHVSGYGGFAFFGDKDEAEMQLQAKTEWEGGEGYGRTATPSEAAEGLARIRWRQANGYPMSEMDLDA